MKHPSSHSALSSLVNWPTQLSLRLGKAAAGFPKLGGTARCVILASIHIIKVCDYLFLWLCLEIDVFGFCF